MKLDYTPPGWDAPIGDVILALRTSIETARELDSFLPLGTELGRELDNIAARVTKLVDVLVSIPSGAQVLADLQVAGVSLDETDLIIGARVLGKALGPK